MATRGHDSALAGARVFAGARRGEREKGPGEGEVEGENTGASTALEGARASSSVAWKQEVALGLGMPSTATSSWLQEEDDKSHWAGLGQAWWLQVSWASFSFSIFLLFFSVSFVLFCFYNKTFL